MIQSLLISLILWLWDNRSFDSITKSNRAKVEAQRAYLEEDYSRAASAYNQVLKASLFAEPETRLNLAHAHLQLKHLPQAKSYYGQLVRVNNKRLSSQAYNQLGVIAAYEKDTSEALHYFQQSLRQDIDNQIARHNYEFLKFQFSGRTPPPPPPTPAPTPSPAPTAAPTPEEAEEMVKTEQKKQLLDRLQALKMSEAQALLILDAMKNTEAQFFEQLKHRAPTDDSKGKW